MTLRYIPQSVGIIHSLHYRKILINVFNGPWIGSYHLMFLNAKFYICMGQFNPNHSYTMASADIILQDIFEEKDLAWCNY